LNYSIYRFVACVDRIKVEVTFGKQTNFHTVQRVLHEALRIPQGRNIYVEAQDAAAGGSASRYRFVLQAPKSWRVVADVLDGLHAWCQFAAPPRVVGVEVALDGYCRQPGLRGGLVDLAAHFYSGLVEVASDNRRFSGLKGTVQGVYNQGQLRRMFDAGRTLNIGNDGEPWTQRIYIKSTDEGGRVNLPVNEYRARIENTYQGNALPASALNEWQGFKFERLSKHYRFMKPVEAASPVMVVAMNGMPQIGERRRRRRVVDGKVIGSRVTSPNTAADTALNSRAYDALRELSRKWSA
jgi:hypothetical protein